MSKKLFAAMVLAAVSASHAYAIAPCSQVCPGPDEPCSLRCYLPNHFVTTCDQVYNGRCEPIFGVTETAPETTVCEADAQPEVELAPIVIAWVDAGVALAHRALAFAS